MINACMTNVFNLGSVSQLIFDQQHIRPDFHEIKEMLLVNSVLAVVFEREKEFQQI
jgi:hypothetical protein